MRSPVAELLAELGSALQRLGLRWYLFGAQAAILYGSARLTADVDATVDAGTIDAIELLQELERNGFVARIDDPIGFASSTRVMLLRHDATNLPCDLVLAGPGLESLFMERAVTIRVEDVDVPVAAADDIIVMKILSGRPKDLEDTAAVIAAAGDSLELNRARSTLTSLEQALDRSDLVSTLDRIAARTLRS